nr:hypothetical protein [uncultured Mediterranean phage uvMED]
MSDDEQERKQAALLLCMLKIKYYWFDMDIVGIKGGDTYFEESPKEDEAGIMWLTPTYTEKLMDYLYNYQREAMVIMDSFMPYPEIVKQRFDLDNWGPIDELSKETLLDWLSAFGCLDTVCESDTLVKAYRSDLIKIIKLLKNRWFIENGYSQGEKK